MSEDTISRQVAIDAFYKYPNVNWTTLDVLAKINALPSAQPEPCEDTISRQAAIDAVEESRRLNHHQDGKAACAHEYEHRHFLKLLRDLPSAQPEPCEDTISRKAAIELVKDVCDAIMSECESRYDPEIKDEVYTDIREVNAILKCNKEMRIALRNIPSAQSEIIRCKDCKYWTHIKRTNRYWCKTDDGLFDLNPSPDDFCSRAKRRTDE